MKNKPVLGAAQKYTRQNNLEWGFATFIFLKIKLIIKHSLNHIFIMANTILSAALGLQNSTNNIVCKMTQTFQTTSVIEVWYTQGCFFAFEDLTQS